MSSSGANTPNGTVTAAPPVPKAQPNPNSENEKQLTDAIKRYKQLAEEAGGTENLHKIFELVGTDGFAPPKKSSDEEFKRANELKEQTKLDTKLQDYSGRELGYAERPRTYGAKYIDHEWAMDSIATPDDPATLSDEAWRNLAISTQYFHGWLLGDQKGLKRARFPAFCLKPTVGPGQSEASISSIPHFEVFDDSWLSIKETETETERSMANNGFSSSAIEASVSGGGYGVSVAASASVSSESQRSSSKTTSSHSKEYVATYNFPRVRVFLDKYNLAVTPRCAEYLSAVRTAAEKAASTWNGGRPNEDGQKNVKDAKDLKDRFFKEYGQIFATNFLLGGQLTGSRSSASFGEVSEAVARDAMKMAASLSVEYKGAGVSAGASVSASKEESSSSSKKESTAITNSSLTWSARGGNTLLCANPSEWANSVANHSSWRVLEQDGVVYLPDLIKELTAGQSSAVIASGQKIWDDIDDVLATIQKQSYQALPEVPSGTFKGFIRLQTSDGQYLTWKTDPWNKNLCLGLTESSSDACNLQVLDADIAKDDQAAPVPAQLKADVPLYLITQLGYGRANESGGQIPGMHVEEGLLRKENDNTICRWSFKSRNSSPPLNLSNTWKGQGNIVVNDGDEVTLHCHSFRYGSYRNPMDKAPYFAPAVVARHDARSVLCVGTRTADSMLNGLERVMAKGRGFFDLTWVDARPCLKTDLRRAIEDPNTLKALMRSFDQKRESQNDRDLLEDLRVFFGIFDTDNNYKWDQLWVTGDAKWVEGASGLPFVDRDILLASIRRQMEQNLKALAHIDDRNTPPITFKVKFMGSMSN